jgi:WD40 repeat protein
MRYLYLMIITTGMLLSILFNPAASQAQSSTNPVIYSVAWSPDGTRLAEVGFTISTTASGTEHRPYIVIRNRGGAAETVTNLALLPNGHEIYVPGVDWSPDGRYLVTGGAEGRAIVWEVNGAYFNTGRIAAYLQDSLFTRYALPANLSWSPDGKWIAIRHGYQGISLWNAQNSAFTFTSRETGEGSSDLRWSPDSQWLAVGGNGPGLIVYKITSQGVVDREQSYLVDQPRVVNFAETQRGLAWDVTQGNRFKRFSRINQRVLRHPFHMDG